MKKTIHLLLLLLVSFSACNKNENITNSTATNSNQSKIPVLGVTTTATEVTQFTAISGGVVLSDGGSNVTQRGVCYSKSPNPTVNNLKTIDAAGTGEFKSEIKNLELNTTYYLRSYATNQFGTGYGLQIQIKTLQPDVGTIMDGGTVVYIFTNKDKGYVEGEVHGLIIGDKIIGNFPFGCTGKRINYNYGLGTEPPGSYGGGDSDIARLIGYGSDNTKAILKSCADRNNAAYACDTSNLNGFSDWFLPNTRELEFAMGSMLPGQKNFYLISKLKLPQDFSFLCSNDLDEISSWITSQYLVSQTFLAIKSQGARKIDGRQVIPMRKF
jgi:hypothetical protein